MTTTPTPQSNANPAQGSPAEGPDERKVIDLVKKAFTELQAEQAQTRTDPEPEKSFIQKWFG